MNNSLIKLFCTILIFSQFLKSINADILSTNGIIEALNIRIIRNGINNTKPENFSNIAMKLYVFEKDENNNLIEVYKGEKTSVLGYNALPLCMHYAIFHMSIKERVMLDCPAKWGFKDNHLPFFQELKTNKDYIIDLQLWNIGDIYTLVE